MITSPVVKPMTGPVVKGLIGSAGGGGAFNPTHVSGLVLWLDAANRGVTTDQWDDRSGQSNHFTKAPAGTMPTFSSGEAIFNGTSTYLNGPTFDTLTTGECFALVKRSSDAVTTGTDSGNFHAFSRSSGTGHYAYNNEIYDGFGRAALVTVGDPTPDISQYRIINILSKPGAWTYKMDGSPLYTAGANSVFWNQTASTIGSSASTGGYYFDGNMKCYLLYNKELSTAERANVTTYLESL